MAINIQYSSELPFFSLDNSLMSLRRRDRAFSAAMRYSTPYTDTYLPTSQPRHQRRQSPTTDISDEE